MMCFECGKKSKYVYPVIQMADRTILRVCPFCYQIKYRPWFWKPVKRELTKGRKDH